MIEYFSSNMWQLWLAVTLLCLVVELMSGDLFVACFAFGAFITIFAAALGVPVVWQVVIFAVVSVLSLFLIRPALLKRLHKNADPRVSNVDAIIGRTGRVSEAIEAGAFGRVALDGDDWKARHVNGDAVEKGAIVRIIGIKGIIVTVERAETENN